MSFPVAVGAAVEKDAIEMHEMYDMANDADEGKVHEAVHPLSHLAGATTDNCLRTI
jgi:hypothetical protein